MERFHQLPRHFKIAIGVAAAGVIAGGAAVAGKTKRHTTITISATEPLVEETTTTTRRSRPNLEADRLLLDVMSGPEELFRRVDEAQTEQLLDSLDALAALLGEAQRSGSPVLFARALRQKRRGCAALDGLLAASRRRFPSRASDAAEDTEVLRKVFGDYVHNIQQASSLALLEQQDDDDHCGRGQ